MNRAPCGSQCSLRMIGAKVLVEQDARWPLELECLPPGSWWRA